MIIRHPIRAGNRNKHWIYVHDRTLEFVDIWPIEGPVLGMHNFPHVKKADDKGLTLIRETAHEIGVPRHDVELPLGLLQITDPAIRWLTLEKIAELKSWDHRPDTRVAHLVFSNQTFCLLPDQWAITDPPERAQNAKRLKFTLDVWRQNGYQGKAHFFYNNNLQGENQAADPEEMLEKAAKALQRGENYLPNSPRSVKRPR